MIKVFILDDTRSISEAVRAAGISLPLGSAHVTLCRTFRWDGEKLTQDFQDADDMIMACPIFDLWILDNDLGPGLEGMEFLKRSLEKYPERLPKSLRSCSSNPDRRRDIQALFDNYQKAQNHA